MSARFLRLRTRKSALALISTPVIHSLQARRWFSLVFRSRKVSENSIAFEPDFYYTLFVSFCLLGGIKDLGWDAYKHELDVIKQDRVNRQAKNSVFLNLFMRKEYQLQLYKELFPADTTITEDDLELVTRITC
jgi:hypothetical protein